MLRAVKCIPLKFIYIRVKLGEPLPVISFFCTAKLAIIEDQEEFMSK